MAVGPLQLDARQHREERATATPGTLVEPHGATATTPAPGSNIPESKGASTLAEDGEYRVANRHSRRRLSASVYGI
jgi:hypothetical protein